MEVFTKLFSPDAITASPFIPPVLEESPLELDGDLFLLDSEPTELISTLDGSYIKVVYLEETDEILFNVRV